MSTWSSSALVLNALGAVVLLHGCSGECIRNSDCRSDSHCLAGSCVLTSPFDAAVNPDAGVDAGAANPDAGVGVGGDTPIATPTAGSEAPPTPPPTSDGGTAPGSDAGATAPQSGLDGGVVPARDGGTLPPVVPGPGTDMDGGLDGGSREPTDAGRGDGSSLDGGAPDSGAADAGVEAGR